MLCGDVAINADKVFLYVSPISPLSSSSPDHFSFRLEMSVHSTHSPYRSKIDDSMTTSTEALVTAAMGVVAAEDEKRTLERNPNLYKDCTWGLGFGIDNTHGET